MKGKEADNSGKGQGKLALKCTCGETCQGASWATARVGRHTLNKLSETLIMWWGQESLERLQRGKCAG